MKTLLVVLSACVAASNAGIAGFGGSGGFQSNNNVGSASGGYSDQSSGFNSFGNDGRLGGNNFGIAGGFGSSFSSGLGGAASGGLGNLASGNNNGQLQQNQQGGQVRRFVSVHVAPEESVSTEPRIIRAGGPADTHYNIIFVKAPSASNQQQTEVVLPEQPQQKTLVYVLIKKPEENQDNVKIRAPSPTRPSKPEVFFIRYKPDSDPTSGLAGGSGDSSSNNNFGGNNNGAFSGSGTGSVGSAYGPPPQPNAPVSLGGYQ